MSVWKTMPGDIPKDGDVVWVRLRDWSGEPFQAKWTASEQTFTDQTNSLVFPWWIVARWRDL